MGSIYLKDDDVVVYHQSIKSIDKLFCHKFSKVHSEREMFVTWFNTNRNGYCAAENTDPSDFERWVYRDPDFD